MLKIDQLSIKYGAATAVHDASIQVQKAELLAILGANGAGKSSLGKAIAGLVKYSGSVELEGEDLGSASSASRVKSGIVYVPEGRRVFTQMTVEDNLRAGGFVRRRHSDWRRRRDEVYDLVPRLSDRSSMRAGLLSGGEQQLLALGRAMMAEPRVLVLDEPSLGLAPMAIDIVADFLLKLSVDGGLTVLLLEQNVAFATRLATRGYIMNLGMVQTEIGRDTLADPEAVRNYLTNTPEESRS